MVRKGTDAIDEGNAEPTEEDVARARPFRAVFPKQYEAWKRTRERALVKQPKGEF